MFSSECKYQLNSLGAKANNLYQIHRVARPQKTIRGDFIQFHQRQTNQCAEPLLRSKSQTLTSLDASTRSRANDSVERGLQCKIRVLDRSNLGQVPLLGSSQERLRSSTMPILKAEPDCYPNHLFEMSEIEDGPWWLLYTKSRQEKQLMRHLRQLELLHYAPQIESRKRSPAGRIRTSYIPLFTNYVFLCGEEMARYKAICTGCVIQASEVIDTTTFVHDLKQVYQLIKMGVPLTLESRMSAGQRVRIKNGPFSGYEGIVIRRENETRLLVSVKFMEQGVSAKLDDCQLEAVA